MQNSGDLAAQLSAGLRPVRVKSLGALTARYFISLLISGALLLAFLGPASGVGSRIGRWDFLTSWILIVLAAFSASFLLALLSQPGRTVPRLLRGLFFAVLAAAFFIPLARVFVNAGGVTGAPLEHGWSCTLTALGYGAATSSLLALELRRQAPVQLTSAALLGFLSSGAMVALVLQFHCPNENPVHLLLWHLTLPIAILAALSRRLSDWALRW